MHRLFLTRALAPSPRLPARLRRSAIMAAWAVLQAALVVQAAAGVGGAGEGAAAAAAVLAGYVLADLGSGVFHWSVDNYGGASTPVLGSIIDSFQGHHARPWTITQREWANNLSGPVVVHLPLLAAALALPGGAPAKAFAAAFLACTALAQQTHAWSHLKRGDVPAPVLALQDAGVLVSCRAHGAHHKPPFASNYCIVSGLWNEFLDGGLLARAEQVIYDRTGVAPRGWTEPGGKWAAPVEAAAE